jgi:hypothetical protein
VQLVLRQSYSEVSSSSGKIRPTDLSTQHVVVHGVGTLVCVHVPCEIRNDG